MTESNDWGVTASKVKIVTLSLITGMGFTVACILAFLALDYVFTHNPHVGFLSLWTPVATFMGYVILVELKWIEPRWSQ